MRQKRSESARERRTALYKSDLHDHHFDYSKYRYMALTHVWPWLVEFNGVVTEFFFAFSLHLFSRKFHPVKPEISSAPLFKVFCPRRADSFAGKATLTSGLLLGRSEVLRSLRHNLRAQSQGHRTIVRLEERRGKRKR